LHIVAYLFRWLSGRRLRVQYFGGERQSDGGAAPPSDPRQARRRLRRSSITGGVPLTYVSGEWTACTRACGGAGLQRRPVACEVRGTPDYQLVVNERYCEHRDLVKPNHMQDCGYVMCPMWEAGPWSEVNGLLTILQTEITVCCFFTCNGRL